MNILYALTGIIIVVGLYIIWINITHKHDNSEQKEVTEAEKESATIESKPKISEPVYEYIRQVKANPSRLQYNDIGYNAEYENNYITSYRKVYDSILEKEFNVVIKDVYEEEAEIIGRILDCKHNFMCGLYIDSVELSWLTKDELDYLFDEVYLFYKERRKRYRHCINRHNIKREKQMVENYFTKEAYYTEHGREIYMNRILNI